MVCSCYQVGYYSGDQMEDEIGGACNTYGEEVKCRQFCWEHLKDRVTWKT
jgi:hypothetical protein